ncbi:MAG TPA: RNA polymerase sigma factor [Thermoleophilaceae bacterium]|jgi:RNA polymerase sigma-70 factor (ECF subfamily)
MSPVLTLLTTMPESDEWLASLTAGGREQEDATERLHGLLLRAARFEVGRRRSALDSAVDVEQLAADAAHDALMKVLAKLDTFRGESRFTTWVYKFALLEAATKVRRRSWRDREVALDPEAWTRMPVLEEGPAGQAETSELMDAVRRGIQEVLTPHQRVVLVSVTLEGVPIDVLAERLDSTRGAVYKTLHDARRKLRQQLAEQGFDLELQRQEAA